MHSQSTSLREKCPNTEDQKNLRIWTLFTQCLESKCFYIPVNRKSTEKNLCSRGVGSFDLLGGGGRGGAV